MLVAVFLDRFEMESAVDSVSDSFSEYQSERLERSRSGCDGVGEGGDEDG